MNLSQRLSLIPSMKPYSSSTEKDRKIKQDVYGENFGTCCSNSECRGRAARPSTVNKDPDFWLPCIVGAVIFAVGLD
jgi:hypothetical protein